MYLLYRGVVLAKSIIVIKEELNQIKDNIERQVNKRGNRLLNLFRDLIERELRKREKYLI